MRLKIVLCLFICTLGTAAYCDEQAADSSIISEIPDPNLELRPDEHDYIDNPNTPALVDTDGRFNSAARYKKEDQESGHKLNKRGRNKTN